MVQGFTVSVIESDLPRSAAREGSAFDCCFCCY